MITNINLSGYTVHWKTEFCVGFRHYPECAFKKEARALHKKHMPHSKIISIHKGPVLFSFKYTWDKP